MRMGTGAAVAAVTTSTLAAAAAAVIAPAAIAAADATAAITAAAVAAVGATERSAEDPKDEECGGEGGDGIFTPLRRHPLSPGQRGHSPRLPTPADRGAKVPPRANPTQRVKGLTLTAGEDAAVGVGVDPDAADADTVTASGGWWSGLGPVLLVGGMALLVPMLLRLRPRARG